MPNWCENKLEIEKGVDEFVEKYTSIDEDGHRFFDLEKVIPTLSDMLEDGRWFTWRVDHWGTKWNLSGQTTTFSDDYSEVYFDSAWSPPVGALERISKQCPNIQFHMYYVELGCFFAGSVDFDGDFFSIDYDLDPKHVAEVEFGWDLSDLFSDEPEEVA